MHLSIVTTLYRSSEYINDFYKRISKEAQKISNNYEVIFVNDGSPDDSLEKAIALSKKESYIKVIELSRNFGHHKAIMTGLSYARGDFVFLIDSDLEEEPELLGRFWHELHEDANVDAVYGVQNKRKGKWFEKISGYLFYKIFNGLSENKIPQNFLTIRLMTRNYVDNLMGFTERELTFASIIQQNGFNVKEIKVKKLEHSKTSYSFLSKLSIFTNAITSSTIKPLWLIFNFGLLVTSSSVFFILYLIYRKLFEGIATDGWTSVVVLISFFGGVIIFFLGIIGIYLSKIFIEVKNRPFTIVKKIYQNEK